MIEFEITNEMLEKAGERLYQMERSVKVAFEELFPYLDFEEDFLQNRNFTNMKYLFEKVEKAVDERGDDHYDALYKLLDCTLEGLMYERVREDAIEAIGNINEEEIEELITWLQEKGLSYKRTQDSQIEIVPTGVFLNEWR